MLIHTNIVNFCSEISNSLSDWTISSCAGVSNPGPRNRPRNKILLTDTSATQTCRILEANLHFFSH